MMFQAAPTISKRNATAHIVLASGIAVGSPQGAICALHGKSISAWCRVELEVLTLYRQEVNRIADQLQPPALPAYCIPPAKHSDRIGSNGAATTSSLGNFS